MITEWSGLLDIKGTYKFFNISFLGCFLSDHPSHIYEGKWEIREEVIKLSD